MFVQPDNQEVTATVEKSAGNAPRAGFVERVDQFYAEKNDWKKMNGGCPISADINATLELLSSSVHPAVADLPAMVRASVLKYAAEGQSFEQIWSDKISEGGNFVGVVDGVFGFYRGEEKLQTNNKPLQISAMPAVLQLREKERSMVKDRAKLAREALLADFRGPKVEISVPPAIKSEDSLSPGLENLVEVPVVEAESQYQYTQTGAALEMPNSGVNAGQL